MSITAKVHKMDVEGIVEIVLALADSEIIGKTFGSDFFINPRFYQGKEINDSGIEGLVKNATIINAAGKDSVGKLVSMGLVDKNGVQDMGGVPHAQVILVRD